MKINLELPEQTEQNIIDKCNQLICERQIGSKSWKAVMDKLYSDIAVACTGTVDVVKALIAKELCISISKLNLIIIGTETFYDFCMVEKNILNCVNGYSTLQKFHSLAILVSGYKKILSESQISTYNSYLKKIQNNELINRVELENLAYEIRGLSKEECINYANNQRQLRKLKNPLDRIKLTIDKVNEDTLPELTKKNVIVDGKLEEFYSYFKTITVAYNNYCLHLLSQAIENLSIEGFKKVLTQSRKDDDFLDTILSILKIHKNKNSEKVFWFNNIIQNIIA